MFVKHAAEIGSSQDHSAVTRTLIRRTNPRILHGQTHMFLIMVSECNQVCHEISCELKDLQFRLDVKRDGTICSVDESVYYKASDASPSKGKPAST
jgi:hypothetical protein